MVTAVATKTGKPVGKPIAPPPTREEKRAAARNLGAIYRHVLRYNRHFLPFGAELNIRILRDNAAAQKEVVDRINQQIQQQIQILSSDEKAVFNALNNVNLTKVTKEALDSVKKIFDPIGIAGETSGAPVEAAQTTVDYGKETLDRSMKEKARLLEELNVAVTALQAAVDKLSSAMKEHYYERLTEIDRLRVHIKENIYAGDLESRTAGSTILSHLQHPRPRYPG